MDLSGVIFVVLALVWAVYLLPKALHHHDEVARTRSVEEVSDQARVVVSAPGRDPRAPGRVRRVRTAAAERTAALSPAGRAARRRRRILGVLLAACAVTGVAVATAVLPTWAVAVPVGLLVGFLVLCRVLVRRDRHRRVAARRTWDPAATPAEQSPVVEVPVDEVPVDEVPVDEVPVVEAGQPAAPIPAPVGSLDDTGAFRELLEVPAQRTAGSHGAEPVDTRPAGSLWDPLPVTLPTYVGKQRAMRSVRTISLGDPVVSSSGHYAADSALVAGARATAGETGGESQRVVGG